MRTLGLTLMLVVCGCGGDSSPSPDAAAGEVDAGGGSVDAGAPDGAAGGGLDPAEYDAMGCLTVDSAHPLCCERPGGEVDECAGEPGAGQSLCGFMAACGLTDVSQCSIDCVMAPSVFCVTETQVQCVIDAWAAQMCTSAEMCTGWLHFGG